MFKKLREKARLRGIAQQLYGSIVAQARKEVFYLDFAVPDSVEGRYELISLHLFMLLHVWKKDFGSEDALGKYVLEYFFSELDGSLREMGISDLKVPKRMRKLADGFYTRLYNYSTAIDTGNKDQLKQALCDYLYQQADEKDTTKSAQAENLKADLAEKIEQMADYIEVNLQNLQSAASQDLRQGTIVFKGPYR